jgi:hypothetical protein
LNVRTSYMMIPNEYTSLAVLSSLASSSCKGNTDTH